jgi:hypothetical protein
MIDAIAPSGKKKALDQPVHFDQEVALCCPDQLQIRREQPEILRRHQREQPVAALGLRKAGHVLVPNRARALPSLNRLRAGS